MKHFIKKQSARKPVREDRSTNIQRLIEDCLAATAIVLIVEGFNQGTLIKLINYIIQMPWAFILNWMIVLCSVSIGELSHRRRAWMGIVSLVWIGFSIANYMCIVSRTTPLMPGDLMLTSDLLGLSTRYYTWLELIAIILGIILMLAAIVFMILRLPRRKTVEYQTTLPYCGLLIAVTASIVVFSQSAGWIRDLDTDRVYAYRNYGFSTCFTASISTMGVQKPTQYSADTAEQIVSEAEENIETVATAAPSSVGNADPNIIYVQLESFFDVDTVIGAEYSSDVLPNYHALLKDCPNATLYMPSVGGGTSNAEFEVMTGMNIDFFGAGETTYHTIVQEKTCESIAYILNRRGYTSTAIHSNTATFYYRNIVYGNLGYDRFISIEYMPEPELARNGWPRDAFLTDQIMDVLKASEGPDMVFTITVESHGKYAETYEYEDGDISVTGLPEGMYETPMLNYINLLRDVDTFIGELTETVSKWSEPTIIVFYGDHLPGLGLEAEMLTTGDVYASHYVIWNNYGAEFTASDMQAYRLSADLLLQLGITDGVIMTYHQSNPDTSSASEEYLEKLKTLEYDLLYGEQAAYGDSDIPEATDLQLGLIPIEITNARVGFGRLLVEGKNFNPHSKIILGDAVIDTIYIDSGQLAAVVNESTLASDQVCVAQVADDGTELSRTSVITIQ